MPLRISIISLKTSFRQIAKDFSIPLIFVCSGPVYVIHKGICFVWRIFGRQHCQIISNIRRRECYNEWGERNLLSLSYDQNFDWYAPGIFHFLIGQWRLDANRLEICRVRRGRRSCEIFFYLCKFFRKQCVPLLSLCRIMKFTHLIGMFSHTFFPKTIQFLHINFNINKARTKIIFIEINAVLLLGKIAKKNFSV